jgi:predicted DNA-binding transcriptional regulator AlpA
MSTDKSQLITRTDGLCGKAERRVITGIPDSTWDELEERGEAPARTYVGRRCFWSRQELLGWVAERLAGRGDDIWLPVAERGQDTWQPLGHIAQSIIEKAGQR